MEFQKVVDFLDTTSDDKNLPRFVTKKWIEVYGQSEKNYSPNKEILMIKICQDLLLKNELKFMINQKKIIAQTKTLESKHQC